MSAEAVALTHSYARPHTDAHTVAGPPYAVTGIVTHRLELTVITTETCAYSYTIRIW